MKRYIRSNESADINSSISVFWSYYPNGDEYDEVVTDSCDVDSVEQGIEVLIEKSNEFSGIYWAGGSVEDNNGNIFYEITSDNDHFDNR